MLSPHRKDEKYPVLSPEPSSHLLPPLFVPATVAAFAPFLFPFAVEAPAAAAVGVPPNEATLPARLVLVEEDAEDLRAPPPPPPPSPRVLDEDLPLTSSMALFCLCVLIFRGQVGKVFC